MAMATDWARPPRQVPGASYWYAHTDQWRYDGYGADKLASPVGRGRFAASTPWTCWPRRWRWAGARITPSSTGPVWTSPTRRRAADRDVADYVAEQLGQRKLKLAVTDPDNPVNWPRVLTVWRANLIGSSGKGGEYFLRHLLGTDSNAPAQPPEDGRAAHRRGLGRATSPRASST